MKSIVDNMLFLFKDQPTSKLALKNQLKLVQDLKMSLLSEKKELWHNLLELTDENDEITENLTAIKKKKREMKTKEEEYTKLIADHNKNALKIYENTVSDEKPSVEILKKEEQIKISYQKLEAILIYKDKLSKQIAANKEMLAREKEQFEVMS